MKKVSGCRLSDGDGPVTDEELRGCGCERCLTELKGREGMRVLLGRPCYPFDGRAA